MPIPNFLLQYFVLHCVSLQNCESPLHMACKFGFDKVVQILTSHPRTDKFLKNKYGETPKDVSPFIRIKWKLFC